MSSIQLYYHYLLCPPSWLPSLFFKSFDFSKFAASFVSRNHVFTTSDGNIIKNEVEKKKTEQILFKKIKLFVKKITVFRFQLEFAE